MRKAASVKSLERLGRERLPRNFYMREFLMSEVAHFHGLLNVPDDPDLAIAAGKKLCEALLEPLHATFGKVVIRSAYRSESVNGFCNRMQREGRPGYTCAANAANYAGHIWDRRDADGAMGATACVVIPWFADRSARGTDWRALAWWVHDHLPYSHLQFFPHDAAFNIGWHERPARRIDSFIAPKGCLTKPGMANHGGRHADWYPGFPAPVFG